MEWASWPEMNSRDDKDIQMCDTFRCNNASIVSSPFSVTISSGSILSRLLFFLFPFLVVYYLTARITWPTDYLLNVSYNRCVFSLRVSFYWLNVGWDAEEFSPHFLGLIEDDWKWVCFLSPPLWTIDISFQLSFRNVFDGIFIRFPIRSQNN